MKDVSLYLMTMLFQFMGNLGTGLGNSEMLDDTIFPIIDGLATAVKPVGYVLLAVFVMVEFSQLSERISSVTGHMGLSLVLEILFKFVLCKIVIDNSTEICQFIITITDTVSAKVGGTTDTEILTQSQIQAYLENIFPEWWDVLGQVAMFLIILVFCLLSVICLAIIYVVFAARIIELYAYTAISPIPLSTCLSKNFNVAPNFLKNLFAVGLQGTLLILLIKIFNILMMKELSGIISGGVGTGILSFIVSGSSSFAQCLNLLVVTAFMCILMLVCTFQTQKWAKSICHAI